MWSADHMRMRYVPCGKAQAAPSSNRRTAGDPVHRSSPLHGDVGYGCLGIVSRVGCLVAKYLGIENTRRGQLVAPRLRMPS